MPLIVDPNYWLAVPGGRYRLGLTEAEAEKLAEQSAAWAKEEGVGFSANETKMLKQSAELLSTTANPAWVKEYLKTAVPAHEVDIPAFAIARRPITNAQYRQFMAETGETAAPSAWVRDPANREDDVTAVGIPWSVAEAIAAWAGARLPFEHEWERAVRGTGHRLFPWGNELRPIGVRVLSDGYPRVLPASLTRTPEGLEGAVEANPEWCVDHWTGEGGEAWGRVLRGGSSLKSAVPSAVTREFGDPSQYASESASVRLVRADSRAAPGAHPATPSRNTARDRVRTFETRILTPALEKLRSSPLSEDHALETDWSGHFSRNPPALKLALKAMGDDSSVRAGMPESPKDWAYGVFLAASSKESFRRIPKEHGIFLWNIQYRLAEDGVVRARPIAVYRMAFDKALHRFENRFRASEVETPLDQITEEMVRASVLDAFQFYVATADADTSPFGT